MPPPAPPIPPFLRRLSWLAAAAALALYAAAFCHSPAADPDEPARHAFLERMAAPGPADDGERALAEAYWRRYPDVAADRYFGAHGQLGRAGAREHYQRHGRREGRVWGNDPP